MGERGQARILSHLVAAGLNPNEGKAYLALLEAEGEGLTGYEVAARSSIPRSAVYATLRRLEDLGACFRMGEEPTHFVATDAVRFVDDMRTRTLGRLEELEESLAHLPKRDRPEPVWIFSSYEEVLSRITDLLYGAQKSVWLSLWNREIEALGTPLAKVAERELHRVLFSPDRGTDVAGFQTWGDASPDAPKTAWSHRAIVVIDGRAALIGGSEPLADNHAVLTSNPSLVTMATNHVILDITLLATRTGRDCAADVAPMMRTELDR